MPHKTKATPKDRQCGNTKPVQINSCPAGGQKNLLTRSALVGEALKSASGYSCSLGFRRWRKSTSLLRAAVINCPVLSPGSFTFSTAFITSWGTLAATVCDFAFTALVAMPVSPLTNKTQYALKKNSVQHLTCLTPAFKLVLNTFLLRVETAKPGSVGALTGLLTTNDS
ncbi:TPA: hypothetical protein G8W54_002644 [Salmonella enterica]|uniref:Ash family protein n=1 Tax=Salmonella enterica TaxID=28901 RepID=A0A765BX51_SALER|nr:hypothetical protein [Salmonella enterica]HAG1895282.1 hypothetical protein [Salmonella enterica]HAG5376584.1 hypothetical protein [Salmonella enterica]